MEMQPARLASELAFQASVTAFTSITHLIIAIASPVERKPRSRTTQAQFMNLVAGSTYYFRITAYNTTGLESEPSATVYYTQPQPGPAAPSNLACTVDSSTQIRLQWM